LPTKKYGGPYDVIHNLENSKIKLIADHIRLESISNQKLLLITA